jgi:iron complex outermembrane receptor protein
LHAIRNSDIGPAVTKGDFMSAFALLAGTALVALTPGAAATDDTTDAQRKVADGQSGGDILVEGR